MTHTWYELARQEKGTLATCLTSQRTQSWLHHADTTSLSLVIPSLGKAESSDIMFESNENETFQVLVLTRTSA